MILLVVVLMLALFLVVGLSFVYYSQASSENARTYRESATPDIADIPPETLMSWWLGQLIYDQPDDVNGVASAMRGHSLARTMYGWHPVMYQNTLTVDPNHTNNSLDTAKDPANNFPYSNYANVTAFNGFGPLRQTTGLSPVGVTTSDYDFPNYTWFKLDNILRDPERVGDRGDPTQPLKQYAGGFNPPYTYPDRTSMFVAAMQATDPLTQQPRSQPWLIAQSFVRNTATLPYHHPTNANAIQIDPMTAGGQTFWTSNNPAYKYLTLRPRPADMYYNGPNDPRSFPMPGDAGGDVKQLPGVPFVYSYKNGNQQVYVQTMNDSFWMDLGYPVQITRNGKKFKPLFAFLALPVDGRLNLNVHGNVNGSIVQGQTTYNFQHASNQGLGRHEINISKVLNVDQTQTTPAQEWRQLFTGTATAPISTGRYGYTSNPAQPPTPGLNNNASNVYPDPYAIEYTTQWADLHRSLLAPLDFDAVDASQPYGSSRPVTTHFTLPIQTTLAGQPFFGAFPSYAATYDNYRITTAATSATPQNPLLNHPLLDQKLRLTFSNATVNPAVTIPSDDQMLGDDNMYFLMAGDYRKSTLYNLIPNNLGGNGSNAQLSVLGAKNRTYFSTRSYDVDMPGASPWITDPIASGYTMKANAQPQDYYPNQSGSAAAITTPAPAAIASQPATGDFKPGDGRANLLSRLDLNHKLVSYRDPTTGIVTPQQAALAIADRQRFAKDVFDRLVKATGAVPPQTLFAPNFATADHYNATRWLAQLAANIVDFIDDDDFSTPFNWNPSPDPTLANGDSGWVYGVEAPKLVINEAYAELTNDPNDKTAAISGAKRPYQYNFWFELYNPMPVATPSNGTAPVAISSTNLPTADRQDPDKAYSGVAQDRMAVQLQRTSATLGSSYPAYQILVIDEGPTGTNISPPTFLLQPTNTEGTPRTPQSIKIMVTSFGKDTSAQVAGNFQPPYPDHTYVQPSIGQFNLTNAQPTPPSNTGFYVIAPDSKHSFYIAQPPQDNPGGMSITPTLYLRDQGVAPTQSAQQPWGQASGGTAVNALTYASSQGPTTQPGNNEARKTHTVLLRRLACPSLDPNPLVQDPTSKLWLPMDQTKPPNPYVTVDFMTGLRTNDAVLYTSQPGVPATKNPDYQKVNQRTTLYRVQPLAASVTKQSQHAASPNPISGTFFQHNSTTPPPAPQSATQGQIDWPFDWMVFLDRPLTNLTEIMNVPGVPNHLLTQRFIVGTKDATGQNITAESRQQHLAPWTDQNARIYRALEFFTVGDRSPYPGTGGRVTGKIDINAVFDYDIVNAFIDAQANSNFFTQQAVSDIWKGNGSLSDQTNASFVNRKQQLLGVPGASLPDKPFMSYAAPVIATTPQPDPQYPTGSGIANTILPYPNPAAAAGGQPTLGGTFTPQTSPPQGTPQSINYTVPPNTGQTTPPPYVMNELLTKIAGHVSNRSNNYAVFVTVGFFEVVDDSTSPVKLGAELLTPTGKVLRHQMFAMVDRTNLAIDAGAALDGDPYGRLRQAPNPPTFMSLSDAVPANPVRQGQTVTPIMMNVSGGLPTDYDGVAPLTFKQYQAPPKVAPALWTPGTFQWMFLDSGIYQEPVQVTLDQTGTKLQLLFPNGPQYNHAPGAMLCTYQPGNPGPQGPIDYHSSQYRAVVPFTYIIQ
jgi:hypothetical protein